MFHFLRCPLDYSRIGFVPLLRLRTRLGPSRLRLSKPLVTASLSVRPEKRLRQIGLNLYAKYPQSYSLDRALEATYVTSRYREHH